MKQLISDIEIIPHNVHTNDSVDKHVLSKNTYTGKSRKLFIETYGCQMNFSDTEIVTSIMREQGFDTTDNPDAADVIFLNTCSIRENAELKVRNKLQYFNALKNKKPSLLIGVLGCMAERLKAKLLEEEKTVDLVVGPDAYRDLPNLLAEADEGHKSVNVFLSREETYADINPVRLTGDGVSAFISIMRGCDNMCSFCVVPFTRGRERSRDMYSILTEAKHLFENGYREVTLLGQNVDSYKWATPEGNTIKFATLLEEVARIHPDLRVRFTTSHPKDMTDDVLHVMAKYENICKYIHLPAQSGSNSVLERMNRSYTREWYLQRIHAIRDIVGQDCGISTDLIAGFCNETESEHQDTISLMNEVKYHFAYMFEYSERPNTPAAKKLHDNVPPEVKNKRLKEIISLQNQHSLQINKKEIGKIHKVLIDGYSKKSSEQMRGRTSQNTTVVFPKGNYQKGQYVFVKIHDCTQGTLFGTVV
ncbi:MAG: tRNA (N6-isopentenyl adenosine(37)-C2)-methylthiotransferase MiaB [Cytophagaceae bacterium]|nr:tRNA (N6-isopentenyl adenosine(37)-C2)-methylthiotransferase MiaB [Cytophagaceae bacterium]MDW8456432.1 tRNA (N6-isopentenyl adenosine(37)-C2)-methylthiotransferase MiaB [Cytophagaceae bacterium]